MIRSLPKLLAPIAVAGAALSLSTTSAQALTLFDDNYAPAFWTQSIGGDGSINTSNAPTSITLVGANNLVGQTNTDFTISTPASGTVSFDWAFSTNDGPYWDPFGYLLNGAFNQLSNNGGGSSQSGSVSFSVLTGDVFGFRQNSRDSCCGRASTTITNFNAPVPGPLPLLGAGAAYSLSRQLRKRIGISSGVTPAAGMEG